MSSRLWYATNAAYTKLTKYYTKISSEIFAIATVLDPRYKLDVYDSTQDPIALKASAQLAVGCAFEQYSQKLSTDSTLNLGVQIEAPVSKRQKQFAKYCGCRAK
jgi:hypothetical protein